MRAKVKGREGGREKLWRKVNQSDEEPSQDQDQIISRPGPDHIRTRTRTYQDQSFDMGKYYEEYSPKQMYKLDFYVWPPSMDTQEGNTFPLPPL